MLVLHGPHTSSKPSSNLLQRNAVACSAQATNLCRLTCSRRLAGYKKSQFTNNRVISFGKIECGDIRPCLSNNVLAQPHGINPTTMFSSHVIGIFVQTCGMKTCRSIPKSSLPVKEPSKKRKLHLSPLCQIIALSLEFFTPVFV